jgi:SSS family solute:Na+ symporter
VFIGVLGTLLALKLPSFVDGLMYCYTLWAPTIVLPLVIAVLMEKPCKKAGPAAIVVGGVATGIWEWGMSCPFGVPSLVIGVLFNQIAFWTVHYVSRRHI